MGNGGSTCDSSNTFYICVQMCQLIHKQKTCRQVHDVYMIVYMFLCIQLIIEVTFWYTLNYIPYTNHHYYQLHIPLQCIDAFATPVSSIERPKFKTLEYSTHTHVHQSEVFFIVCVHKLELFFCTVCQISCYLFLIISSVFLFSC